MISTNLFATDRNARRNWTVTQILRWSYDRFDPPRSAPVNGTGRLTVEGTGSLVKGTGLGKNCLLLIAVICENLE